MNIKQKVIDDLKAKAAIQIALIENADNAAFSEVYLAALDLLGSEESAGEWLLSPVYSLGNKRPIELIDSEEEKSKLLGFIDGLQYGVYC